MKGLGIWPHLGLVFRLLLSRAFIWLELGTSPRRHHTWFQLEEKGLQLFIFWASLLLLEPRFGLGSDKRAGGWELDLETVPAAGEGRLPADLEPLPS